MNLFRGYVIQIYAKRNQVSCNLIACILNPDGNVSVSSEATALIPSKIIQTLRYLSIPLQIRLSSSERMLYFASIILCRMEESGLMIASWQVFPITSLLFMS